MRILHITAGAGGMYCGSCLLDNALAAEQLRRGHDVLLLPVYTPTLTDATNVSDAHVFFGGISVYLEQHVPLFRKTPWLLDKLWDNAPVIRAATGRGLSVEPAALGELTVSTLKGEDGFQAKEFRKLLDFLAGQPPFDVVLIPNSLLISLAPALRRELKCPVVCTLAGEDLFLQGLKDEHRVEAQALIRGHASSVDAFISNSDYYADFMASFVGLPRDKVHTVPMGIDLEGHAPRAVRADGALVIGYMARIAPEKGLHLLAEAYRILRKERGLPAARLEAAGYLGSDRGYLEDVRTSLRDAGLEDEFHYRGTLDRSEKIIFLQGLDILSVPSPYAEPKGLYLLEALANGVACVSPRHGTFPEVLGRTGGGLLFEPNDPGDLATQLAQLASDRQAAWELGARGAEGVRRHHSIAAMAERALEVYGSIGAGQSRDRATGGG